MSTELENAIKTLWQYLCLHEQPGPADCLLVLGSRDDRVASHAVTLAQRFSYGTVMVSGGSAHHNDLLATRWTEPTEAEHFLTVMRQQGWSGEVLLEDQATNTGENAMFSHELLKRAGKLPKSLQLVTKPYMERRALATFTAQWPDAETRIRVSSPRLDFAHYINDEQPQADVVHIMVGDLDRIMKYPALGLQTEQVIPQAVMEAYMLLISAGYTRRLLKTV